MKIKFIIFVFALLSCSCKVEHPDEKLTMIRTSYNGAKIRLDGYYSAFIPSYNIYSNFIFYSNGIVLSFNYSSNIQNFFLNSKLIEKIRNDKSSWGIYQIRNDSITIQGWRLNDDVYQYVLINYQLKIVNDTTLYFKNTSGDYTSNYFKQFSPKPDSTNVFIK